MRGGGGRDGFDRLEGVVGCHDLRAASGACGSGG